MKKIVFSLCLLATLPAFAQKKVIADKIIGIVGDKIILKSDIDNQIEDAKRNGYELPEHAECELMSRSLMTKALVLQAEKDSIPVTDEQVESQLDLKIRSYIQRFGSREILEQVAQRSLYQIKEDFRSAIKEGMQAEEMRKKVVERVTVTPTEVQDYFNKLNKDSLPFFESQMEIGQIVISPKPNVELDQYLKDQLTEYKRQVEAGQKTFELLAKLYSDDTGTKEGGGMFQMNRGDKQVDPAFLNNGFRLKEGQISPVFKSKFGYHIIQMVTRNGDDVTVRHILKVPQVTDDELNGAKARLDSVRARLITRTLAFGEAVARFSDDENSKNYGGLLMNQNPQSADAGSNFFTYDALDKDMVTTLKGMGVGEYSQPTIFMDGLKKSVRIVYLKSRTQPHRENLNDDYNKIADEALNVKKNDYFQKWLIKKIPSYYVMLDPDYNCEVLKPWAERSKAVSVNTERVASSN